MGQLMKSIWELNKMVLKIHRYIIHGHEEVEVVKINLVIEGHEVERRSRVWFWMGKFSNSFKNSFSLFPSWINTELIVKVYFDEISILEKVP